MDMGTRSFPRGDIRVSDAERDQAVAELSEHFQAGRLTPDEFEERSGRALQARTGTDISGLFADLPPRRVAAAPQAALPAADPYLPRASLLPVARVVIAFAVAAVIASGLLGGHGHGHDRIGLLVPVVILALVLLRLARLRR